MGSNQSAKGVLPVEILMLLVQLVIWILVLGWLYDVRHSLLRIADSLEMIGKSSDGVESN